VFEVIAVLPLLALLLTLALPRSASEVTRLTLRREQLTERA
jgi:hypothetical protein